MIRTDEQMQDLCTKHLDAFVAEFGGPPELTGYDQLEALCKLIGVAVFGMSQMTDFETVMQLIGTTLGSVAKEAGHRVELVKAHGGIQ